MSIKVDMSLDCKGLACPMPIVKTKKAMEGLTPGQVIEIEATDKGSTVDIQSWANKVGHQYIGTKQEGDVLMHYVRKAHEHEVDEVVKYPHTITNAELQDIVLSGEECTVVDVREAAEFAFGHIPSAISVLLGELASAGLDKTKQIYVVCRTGNRSDVACQMLKEQGYANVKNVIPGMVEW
ncbi:sulfurtransferase TusA family protein [Bacillus cereus]|uniref:Rhodanese-like domain protein n=1 Tax=Bacillus cereus TaxID=1396 RepID=A0A164DL73_BACCE|nr:sulfurtransferase TusA family protein [Bacillus cereus]KZD30514.1 Rhodanese-like domain protein [Bacillus cereus]MCU5341834.1 sulfurtransferase TusA family protein [Bacillus cereus]